MVASRIMVEITPPPRTRRKKKRLVVGHQTDFSRLRRQNTPVFFKVEGTPYLQIRTPPVRFPRTVSPTCISEEKNEIHTVGMENGFMIGVVAQTPSVDFSVEREAYILKDFREPDPNQSTRTCNAEVPLKPFLNGEFDLANWMSVGKNQSHFINFFNPPANGSLSWDKVNFGNIEELIRACKNLGIEDTPALHQELRAFVRKHTKNGARPMGGAGVWKLFRDSFVSEDLPTTPLALGHRPQSSMDSFRSSSAPNPAGRHASSIRFPIIPDENSPILGLTNALLASNQKSVFKDSPYQDSLVHQIVPRPKPYVPPKPIPVRKRRKKHIISLVVKHANRSSSTNSASLPSQPFPKRPKPTDHNIIQNILKRPPSAKAPALSVKIPKLTFSPSVKSPKPKKRNGFPGTPKHRKEKRRHSDRKTLLPKNPTPNHFAPSPKKHVKKDVRKILNLLQEVKRDKKRKKEKGPISSASKQLYDELFQQLGPASIYE